MKLVSQSLEGERLALHQVLAGYITHYYYMPGTTTKLPTPFQVLVTLEIFFFGLGLTVTEINIKKVQKQDLKNIKNVKRCRDGMPKSMQTR